MINFSGNRRIFLARAPVDMRKGTITLANIVEHGLGMDPYAGDIYVFLGKHSNRVKILVWDRSGFWLASKRLERGTFAVPSDTVAPNRPGTVPLSSAEIHLLLEGVCVHRATYHQHYHRPSGPPTPPLAPGRDHLSAGAAP
jgi:transposase